MSTPTNYSGTASSSSVHVAVDAGAGRLPAAARPGRPAHRLPLPAHRRGATAALPPPQGPLLPPPRRHHPRRRPRPPPPVGPARRRRRGEVLLPPAGDEVLAQGRRGNGGGGHRRVEGVRQGKAGPRAAVQAARGRKADARLLPPRWRAHRLGHARVPPPLRRPRRLRRRRQEPSAPYELPCGRGQGLGGLSHIQEEHAGSPRRRRHPFAAHPRYGAAEGRRRHAVVAVVCLVMRNRGFRGRRRRGRGKREQQQQCRF